jgi:hypothetical protein
MYYYRYENFQTKCGQIKVYYCKLDSYSDNNGIYLHCIINSWIENFSGNPYTTQSTEATGNSDIPTEGYAPQYLEE